RRGPDQAGVRERAVGHRGRGLLDARRGAAADVPHARRRHRRVHEGAVGDLSRVLSGRRVSAEYAAGDPPARASRLAGRDRGDRGAAAKGAGGVGVAKGRAPTPPAWLTAYLRRSRSMSVCELVSPPPRLMATSARTITTRRAAATSTAAVG